MVNGIALVVGLMVGTATLNAAPLDAKIVQISGTGSAQLTARVTRIAVVPSMRFGSYPGATAIVVGIDDRKVHFRYGLVWETPRRQFLSAAVVTWTDEDRLVEYSVVGGRTATSRRNGVQTFVLPLPGPAHRTIEVRVAVRSDGSAIVVPGSLHVGKPGDCLCRDHSRRVGAGEGGVQR